MKKLIILLVAIIVTVISVHAYTYPRWRSMPIRVYVPQNNGIYTKLAYKAFNAWQTKSEGIVRFKYVSKPEDSDIYMSFVEYVKSCGSDDAVGCTHYSVNGKGFFTQNYIEIGTKETTVVRKNGKIYRQEAGRSNNHLYGVMIHEVGHALGLDHSKNADSIMYPYDLDKIQYVTNVDLKLLQNKYR